MNEEAAKALRAPFPPEQIGKLPRVTQKDGTKSRCAECGGWLPPHIHLDYVGHAAATDRLLQVDPEWNWEPIAFGEDGTPLVRRDGNDARLWIKLTIAGTTRLGVGIAPGNAFELEKQLISDAIRNAAMRFGVALDLWSKEDLQAPPDGVDSETGEIKTARAGSANTPPEETGGQGQRSGSGPRLASSKQRFALERLIEVHGPPEGCAWPLDDELTMRDASGFLDTLKALPEPPPNERKSTMREDEFSEDPF